MAHGAYAIIYHAVFALSVIDETTAMKPYLVCNYGENHDDRFSVHHWRKFRCLV